MVSEEFLHTVEGRFVLGFIISVVAMYVTYKIAEYTDFLVYVILLFLEVIMLAYYLSGFISIVGEFKSLIFYLGLVAGFFFVLVSFKPEVNPLESEDD